MVHLSSWFQIPLEKAEGQVPSEERVERQTPSKERVEGQIPSEDRAEGHTPSGVPWRCTCLRRAGGGAAALRGAVGGDPLTAGTSPCGS